MHTLDRNRLLPHKRASAGSRVHVLVNLLITVLLAPPNELRHQVVRFGQPKIVKTEIVVIADIFNQ